MNPPVDVMDAYGLRPVAIATGGGTAGRTWRVSTDAGEFFVRQRGARTSHPQRIAFDHGLRAHLAARGYPAVPPLIHTGGNTWIEADGAIFEAYPFVEGLPFSRERLPLVRTSSAEALARLHILAADYTAVCENRVPQFTSYPVPVPPRTRFDDPEAQIEAMDQIVERYQTPENRTSLQRARACIERNGADFVRIYPALRQGVTHGDYNCFNLLFSDTGGVVGVFDFDWAWREARLVDVVTGMFFFGADRDGDLDPGSIWSLTRCPRLELGAMAAFLRAYHRVAPLSEPEIRAIPTMLLAKWVSWRLEGAMKVPEPRRAEFALYGFFSPFEWCEAHSPRLVDALSAS